MSEPRTDGGVLLFVDDDFADRLMVRRALGESEVDCELYAAAGGAEGLDYLFRRGEYRDPENSPRPDLVLVDLNMPEVDGWQVIEAIRGDTEIGQLPVVAFSTSSDDRDVARAYALGANSYLVKPDDFGELRDALTVLLDYWLRIVRRPEAA